MRKRRWPNEQISEIVRQADQLGLSYQEAAHRFDVPLWRIYRYNCQIKNRQLSDRERSTQSNDVSLSANDSDNGNKLSTNGSEDTHSSSSDKKLLPEQVRKIIIDYKRQNPYTGFKRIEQHLRNRYLLIVPRKRIREVLKGAGLLESNDSSFDKAVDAKGTRRFEANRPCELYQMDVTYVYISGLKVLYLINIIDDHSRYCLRSVLRFDQSSDTLIEVLHDAISDHGQPDKLLTDEGSAFYSWSGEKTKFQHYLDDQHIEHIVADPHSPTTTGKVERFHQTIKNELIRKRKFNDYDDAVEKIKAYVRYYNYERPHQALSGARPVDRFMGITTARTMAQHELFDNELNLSKGYLLFKLGVHEVSIALKSDDAPHIVVNGCLYVAQQSLNELVPVK